MGIGFLWLGLKHLAKQKTKSNDWLCKGITLKRPTKKGLINEIETLDSNKVFNLLSLTRTNIDNLIAVRDLLRGGRNDTSK